VYGQVLEILSKELLSHLICMRAQILAVYQTRLFDKHRGVKENT